MQAEILRLLTELQQQTGMAVLLITHDWGVVADIADRAVVMYAGEVVERADVNTLFTPPGSPTPPRCSPPSPASPPKARACPPSPGGSRPGHWPTGCRFAGRCAFATDECTPAPSRC